MKDLKQEIQELKERLAMLEGMVDRVEANTEITREMGKFIPKLEQLYYFIDFEGFVGSTYNNNLEEEINRFDKYSAFPTHEAAEAEARYTKLSREYRAFAKAVNGDWVADYYNREQLKWGIYFEEGELSVRYVDTFNLFIHQVSFRTKELAEKALKEFGCDLSILARP